MERWLAVIACALAGCSAAPAQHDAGLAEPALDPESLSIDVHFAGVDAVRACAAAAVCALQSPASATFEHAVGNDTRVQGVRIFLGWQDRTFDPVGSYRFTAHCLDNGDAGCPEGILLADESGPMPLTLEAHGLRLPAGARIALNVTSLDAAPGAGGTGQPYEIDGVLVVLRDRAVAAP